MTPSNTDDWFLSRRLGEVMAIDSDAAAAYEGDSSWTWRDIQRVRRRLRSLLTELGAPSRGARVALMMKTTCRAVACQTALLADGHTIYTLSPMMGEDRIERDVATSRAWLILADETDWQRPGLIAGTLAAGVPGYAISGPATGDPVAGDPLPRIVSAESPRAGHPATPEVANVMLTSGTTGDPKRIEIGYSALDNMLRAVRHYSDSTRRAQDGRRLSRRPAVIASPLVHSSGFGGVVRALAEARPLVLLERFGVDAFVAAVERFRPASLALPPTALAMILDAGVDPAQLASLRAIVVGSAALPPDLERRFLDRYGIPLLSTYGATEFPGGLAGWTLRDYQEFHERKIGSVGRVHPGAELKVVDPEDGHETPVGERGILVVRTPATDRGVDDGWVRTNDLASRDEDGFYYIHGRADDAILRGGFKVIPQEVERVLEANPAVRAAGVVGIPDDRLGAVPVAAVELSQPVPESELLDDVRRELAAYQVPVRIHVVEELPRTPSMKISKPDLRRLVRALATDPVLSDSERKE